MQIMHLCYDNVLFIKTIRLRIMIWLFVKISNPSEIPAIEVISSWIEESAKFN